MNRRRALVVVPVLLLCAAGVWLLARGERDDRPPAGPTTTTVTAAGPTPGPTLAPPTEARPTGARPATETGPAAATEAGPDAATDRGPGTTPPGVRLRGVCGRVVDASNGQPIAGAFVSWGAPPQKILDAIRSSPALVEAGEGGEITDASGRFELPRVDDDRPRFELFATAAGWLPASTVVGLREEVELRLARAGRLVLRMAGDPGPRGANDGPTDLRRWVGVVADGPGGAHHAHAWGDWPPVLEVAQGRWWIQVDGAEPVEGFVVAGSTSTIELGAPIAVRVEGSVAGLEESGPSGAMLVLARVGDLGSTAPLTAASEYTLSIHGSAFLGSLPPGVYAAGVRFESGSDHSERAIQTPVRITAPGPLQLELALAPSVAVEVHAVSRGVEAPTALGLVGGEDAAPELIALPLVGAPRVVGEAVTQVYGGQLPAGRWSVFVGPTYAGEVDLAEGTPATVVLRPFDVTVRWRLPDGLRDGEVLRGALAVVPLELARRPIGARFREEAAQPFDASRGGEPYRLQLLAPGRYLLCGSTDLGPFEREVELTGATEVEVDLTGK